MWVQVPPPAPLTVSGADRQAVRGPPVYPQKDTPMRLSYLLVALFAAPAWGQNLLINPGFEDGLSGWTVSEVRAGTVEASAVAHDGLGGALVTAPGLVPGAAAIWQDLRVRPGVRYCFSGWLQTLAAGGGFGLAVDAGGGRPVDVLVYGEPGAWSWQRACFIPERKRVRVVLWASPGISAGGGYVDSLALVAQ